MVLSLSESHRPSRNRPPAADYAAALGPMVTFLVDENLPHSFVAALSKMVKGHRIRHVKDLGLCGASDQSLQMLLQCASNPVIITGDADFLSPRVQQKCRVIYLYRKYPSDVNTERHLLRTLARNRALIENFVQAENLGSHLRCMALPIGRRAPARRVQTPLGVCRMPITDPITLAERFPDQFRRKLHSNGWHTPIPFGLAA